MHSSISVIIVLTCFTHTFNYNASLTVTFASILIEHVARVASADVAPHCVVAVLVAHVHSH